MAWGSTLIEANVAEGVTRVMHIRQRGVWGKGPRCGSEDGVGESSRTMSGGEQSTAERNPRLVQCQMDNGSWESWIEDGACLRPEDQGVMGEQSRSLRLCNVMWTIDQRKLHHKGRMEGRMPTR